jgi:hypothetical protein
MTLYAQLDSNRMLVTYPLSIYNIRWLYPNVSWPDEPTQDALDQYNLVIVHETTPPTPTKRNQEVVELDPAPDANGVWWQQWTVQKINQTLAACQEKERETLSNKRWEKETSGISWNGWLVDTDRESQGKLSALYIMCVNNLWAGGRWKFKDGISRELTTAQAIEMCLTVAAYVQSCYDAEGLILDQINAATTDDDAVDWVFE